MKVEEILKISKINKSTLQNKFAGIANYDHIFFENYKKHELNAICFLSIETPVELSRFFKLSILSLEEIINYPIYSSYVIKKKRGGNREILAPEKKLKQIQKHLNYFLQAYYLCIKPSEVNGFVVNPHYLGTYCNIAENAKYHVQKKYVLNIDLKDFFSSITASEVKRIFSSSFFNFNEQVATALALLTTYQGKLPTGAPTSPIVSNFICYKLDNDLKDFCVKHNLIYSRYADDLTFSSDLFITSDIYQGISDIIKNNKFDINKNKVRLKASNRKQIVTGLTVNEKVNVNRKLLKKIRAMLYDLKINGIELAAQKHFKITTTNEFYQTKFINKLQGYVNFVGQVRGKNDELFLKLKEGFSYCIKQKQSTI